MKLSIVQVSESEFSVKGHGVHTAFVETCNALSATDAHVKKNKLWQKADVRHIHTVGPYSLLHLLFGSGKKVVSAHVVPASFVGSLKGAKTWLPVASKYLTWFYNRADIVIAVSDSTKIELESMGVKKPIEVVYNMVDTSRYAEAAKDRDMLRKKYDFSKTDFVIVGNGQVQPRKRADTFVAVAHQLPDMQFVWVGGMPFGSVAANATEMQAIIDNAPKNVRFTGVVELEEVARYFAAGDAFFMPSMQETFGLAIVEAAASGMPVVLRDLPDYDRTFRPDAVMATDEGFATSLARLHDDTAYYKKMQHHSRVIAKKYDSATIVKTLRAIYERSTEP